MINRIPPVAPYSRFGRWTLLEVESHDTKRGWRWLGVCDCGTFRRVYEPLVRKGGSSSCGCYAREKSSCNNRTHGLTNACPEYYIWEGMIQRCHNPRCKGYKRYGARGIKVCERWRWSFENFLSDMGRRPEGLTGAVATYTIGRKNNDGDYCPDNCRWETRSQQNRNLSTTVFAEYEGVRQPVADIADILGIDPNLLRNRVQSGKTVEEALNHPFGARWPEKMIEFKGERLSCAEWASRIDIASTALRWRLTHGWTLEDALTKGRGITGPKSKRLREGQ